MIKEVQAKSALSSHAHEFPTAWDVNPYRGCTIGCRYCFAQYSHEYLGLSDFFRDIVVKTNIHEPLMRELRKKSWTGEQIKLGGIADVYQHCEQKYKLMPALLEVLYKTRTPVFIQTKSTLMLWDKEWIRMLASVTTVDLATSVCSFDEQVRSVLEPGAPSARARMEMLGELRPYCRKTIVSLMPVIPLLSDTDENLDTAFRLTRDLGLDYLVASPLHLRGKTQQSFFRFMQVHFPELYAGFAHLYQGSEPDTVYLHKLYGRIQDLRKHYGVSDDYTIVQPYNPQLSLF